MKNDNKTQCRNCAFWAQNAHFENVGDCRISPPRATDAFAAPIPDALWPVTFDTAFCGEFTARSEPSAGECVVNTPKVVRRFGIWRPHYPAKDDCAMGFELAPPFYPTFEAAVEAGGTPTTIMAFDLLNGRFPATESNENAPA
jgi:hypothetical protein